MATDVGKTIKLLRIAAGLKQKDLADRISVSKNYLSLIENNKREPSLKFLKSLSRELNVPVGFFLLETLEEKYKFSKEQLETYSKIRSLLFQFQKERIQPQANEPELF